MSIVKTDDRFYKEIAEVLREGTGTTKKFLSSELAEAVRKAISGKKDYYGGPYEVEPKFEKVVLETEDKVMSEDVVVNEILVNKASNPEGGYTVWIGRE